MRETGLSTKKVIEKYKSFNIDQTKISKWFKNKDGIVKATSDLEKKKLLKIRPGLKYLELHRELIKVLRETRGKGNTVYFNWLWRKGRNRYRQQQNDPEGSLKKHVTVSFIEKNHIRLRRIHCNKNLPKEHFRTALMKWHSTLCERLIQVRASESGYYWNNFLPLRRF